MFGGSVREQLNRRCDSADNGSTLVLSSEVGLSCDFKLNSALITHACRFNLAAADVRRLRRSATGEVPVPAPQPQVTVSMPGDESWLFPPPVTVSVPPIQLPGGCGCIGCRSCNYPSKPMYGCCRQAEPIGPTTCPAWTVGLSIRPAISIPNIACCSIRPITPCRTIIASIQLSVERSSLPVRHAADPRIADSRGNSSLQIACFDLLRCLSRVFVATPRVNFAAQKILLRFCSEVSRRKSENKFCLRAACLTNFSPPQNRPRVWFDEREH